MWKKYILWRQYEPFFTGWMDMLVFATVLYFIGVGPGGQDPGAAMLYCYGGFGLMLGIPFGGFYNCMKGDWVKEDPHPEKTLRVWKDTAIRIMSRDQKTLTWEEVETYVARLMRSQPEIPVDYARAAILTAHEKHTSRDWLPKEAFKWRKQHPKIWHIMGYF